MQSHTVATTLNRSGEVFSSSKTYEADAEIVLDATVAASTTHEQYAISFDKDRLISVVITSDKDVTIKTNNSSTPGNTIEVTAGSAIVFNEDSPSGQNPFGAADVTTLFITNANTSLATVKLRILWNPIP